MVCGEIVFHVYFKTSIFARNYLVLTTLSNAAFSEDGVHSSVTVN